MVECVFGSGYKPFGHGSRGLKPQIGHPVEHGHVALVAYADGYGEWELSHIRRQFIILKGLEVGGGASATDHHYPIPRLRIGGNLLEGGDDGFRGRRALHHSGEKFRMETQTAGIGVELIHEISVTGGSGSRNYRDALWHRRPLQLPVEFENPLLFQAHEDFTTTTQKVAHGVLGIHCRYYERESVDRMHRR